ncbi:MAG: hypothetical protein Q8L47_03900 [bacterium]|nr:hypothetical protein [bacterium]
MKIIEQKLPHTSHLTPHMGSGQLLIEALVSISIILVGLVGVLNLLANSMRLNRIVSDQYTAVYLASEGIEVIRNIVDTNIASDRITGDNTWSDNVNCRLGYNTCNNDDGCSINYNETLIDSDNAKPNKHQKNHPTDFNPVRFDGTYYNNKNLPQNQMTPFTRNVCVRLFGSELRVRSVVKWKSSGGGDFKVELNDVFYER